MAKYTIKRVESVGDEVMLKQILSRTLYPGDGEAEKRYEWFYAKRNAIAYLLQDENGVAIGTKGYCLREFNIAGKIHNGASSVDIAILPEHRNPAAALFLQRESANDILDGKADFTYGVPNKHAVGIYRRNKMYKSCGFFNRYVKPLEIGDFVPNAFANLFTPLANALWRTANNLRNWGTMKHWECSDFISPDYVDITNESNMSSTDIKCIGDRNFDYVHWRYDKDPQTKFHTFSCYNDAGDESTIIFTNIKNRAYVCDIIHMSGDDKTFVKLFRGFEKFCISEHCSAIVVQSIGWEREMKLLTKRLWYMTIASHATKQVFVGSKNPIDRSIFNWLPGDEDAIGE